MTLTMSDVLSPSMVKRLVWLGLGVIFTVFLALGVLAAAQAYDTASERKVTYRYFSEGLSNPTLPGLDVRWQPAQATLTRSFAVNDEMSVGQRIGSAWAAFATAQDIGRSDMLVDWFGGPALSRSRHAAEQAYATDSRLVVLDIEARPEFFHMDGSVLQVTQEVLATRYAAGRDGLAAFEISRDTVQTTLLNKSTGWSVVSQERLAATPLDAPSSTLRALPGPLVGFNYYPSKSPWTLFWPNYDPAVIAADLALAKDMGSNALRFFLPLADFAKGPDQSRRLAALRDFLKQAEAQGLYLMPTLFDLKGSYGGVAWAQDLDYLQTVLPVLGASPAVVMIDLKNEPDLDFESHGRGHVLAWLRTMATLTRQILPDLPLTIGWSSAEAGAYLIPQLDVITYHEYAPMEGTDTRLKILQDQVGDKPIMVTEIGASAWTLTAGYPSTAQMQQDHITQRMDLLAGVDGVFIWTLHDFPEPDPVAVGSSFWVRALQARFGMITANGVERPVAQDVRQRFQQMTKGRIY